MNKKRWINDDSTIGKRKSDTRHPFGMDVAGAPSFACEGRMMSVEQYWPPEMLAAVFPCEYGDVKPQNEVLNASAERQRAKDRSCRYTVQHLGNGCIVYRLDGSRSPGHQKVGREKT